MKIGLVCPYNLSRPGGVQEILLALRKELQKRGHTVKIIAPRAAGAENDEDTIYIGRSTEWNTPMRTKNDFSMATDLEVLDEMLEREQFDVLNFHEPWIPFLSVQLASRANKMEGGPTTIATFHAKLPDTITTRVLEQVIYPYTKPALKYFDAMTAVSTAAAEYVGSMTDRDITIVPNGIELYKYHSPRTRASRSKLKTILYIGRLEKRKGVRYLLEAYGLLSSKRHDVRLLIAGDGDQRDKLERIVETENIPRVEFLGFVSEQDKRALLAHCDVFCSPAIYGESFGLVLLEAMASRAVTVAGNNPGYASVLQELGRIGLVTPEDTVDFANRLDVLLDDEKLRAMWQEWADTYIQQFDYPNIADQYEAVYEKTRK